MSALKVYTDNIQNSCVKIDTISSWQSDEAELSGEQLEEYLRCCGF